MARKVNTKIKQPFSDRILDVVTSLVLIAIIIIVGYPVVYVVSASVSSAVALQSGQVLLWPVVTTANGFGRLGVNLNGYKFVLQYRQVWIGYRNTVFYTFFGTLITMFLQIIAAYPISRPNFKARKGYTTFILVTMLFGAGLIPTFLIKTALGMYDTVWAILLGGAISGSNIFILRTCFRNSIPQDLFDAAAIDGANDFQCLWKIALPLGKATISVITLYSIVGHWNEYFTAMVYLRNEELYPLSLFLRTMLCSTKSMDVGEMSTDMQQMANNAAEQIRYALIVISTVPVLVAYAIVQKYFKTGVMIGSVKG